MHEVSLRAVEAGGRCYGPPPDFGRSSNPISTRECRLCPPHYYFPPIFKTFPTAPSLTQRWSFVSLRNKGKLLKQVGMCKKCIYICSTSTCCYLRSKYLTEGIFILSEWLWKSFNLENSGVVILAYEAIIIWA